MANPAIKKIVVEAVLKGAGLYENPAFLQQIKDFNNPTQAEYSVETVQD
jgi:hypothetical protein